MLGCCAWICFIDIKLPFSLNQILVALIFVSLGYIIKNTKVFIQEINDRKSRIIYGIIGVVLFIILLLSNCFFGNKISMEKFIFGNVALFLVNAIIGIFMVVFISMAIGKNKILCYYGKNSIIVLCFHYYFCRKAIPFLFGYFGISNQILYNFLVEILLSIIVLAVMIIFIYISNRWLYFVFGKSKYKKVYSLKIKKPDNKSHPVIYLNIFSI